MCLLFPISFCYDDQVFVHLEGSRIRNHSYLIARDLRVAIKCRSTGLDRIRVDEWLPYP